MIEKTGPQPFPSILRKLLLSNLSLVAGCPELGPGGQAQLEDQVGKVHRMEVLASQREPRKQEWEPRPAVESAMLGRSLHDEVRGQVRPCQDSCLDPKGLDR